MADAVRCGPDPERHLQAIRDYDQAGFTHVFFDGTTYNDTPAAAVSAHRGAARCSVAAIAHLTRSRLGSLHPIEVL